MEKTLILYLLFLLLKKKGRLWLWRVKGRINAYFVLDIRSMKGFPKIKVLILIWPLYLTNRLFFLDILECFNFTMELKLAGKRKNSLSED